MRMSAQKGRQTATWTDGMIKAIAPMAGVLLALAGCTEPVTRDGGGRILLMGDSLMAANGLSGQAVSDAMESDLAEPVTDRAVMGARMIYALPLTGAAGLDITRQFRPGDWDWIIVNGGGNDIWMSCGCAGCDRRIDRLISEDGRHGVIPDFLSRMRATGAQVIYVGYMRTPGVTSPIEACGDEGDEMDRRAARLAERVAGIHFLPLAELVPHGDRSYHGIDLIHPSTKGSAAIGGRIARLIRRNSPPEGR